MQLGNFCICDRVKKQRSPVNTDLSPRQRLKYRPLSQLKERQLTIPTFGAIEKTVLHEVYETTAVPPVGFLPQNDWPHMAMLMAKYGALDLTFVASSPVLTASDSISWDGLRMLRLADQDSQLAEEFEWVEQGLIDDVCFLRVFLMFAPPWDAMQLRNEQARAEIANGVPRNLASEAALDYLAENIGQRFPATFLVDDACLTNSKSIWINAHFYL